MYVSRQFLIATIPIFAIQQQLVGRNTSTPGCNESPITLSRLRHLVSHRL